MVGSPHHPYGHFIGTSGVSEALLSRVSENGARSCGEGISQNGTTHVILVHAGRSMPSRRTRLRVTLPGGEGGSNARRAFETRSACVLLFDVRPPYPAPSSSVGREGVGMPRSLHRTGRRWRKARARMFAEFGTTCHLCGHEGATDADHLLPLHLAPSQPVDYRALRPAHGVAGCPVCGRKCNQERSSSSTFVDLNASRAW